VRRSFLLLARAQPQGARDVPVSCLGRRATAQQRIERKLAAILAADVFGYTVLMGADVVIE
jgi:hypothetical protein